MMHVRAIPQIPGALAPLLVLSGCATTGSGKDLAQGIRRLLGISSQRALARLVKDNGYFNAPVARISLPAGINDRSTAVRGALLRSAPVQRELTIVVNRAAGNAADRAAPQIYDSIRR